MSYGSNIISAIHFLKMSKEHFEDFRRQHPGTKGSNLVEIYIRKIDWIINDLKTNPSLPEKVIDGVKIEWNSDVFAVQSINEKIALLNPDQRAIIEHVIEKTLSGEIILEQ